MQLQLEESGVHCVPLPLPSFPPLGWTQITDANRDEVTKLLPTVYPTTLYEYLAEGVGNVSGKGAFRALTRGYVHWEGRLHKLEANTRNPTLCFIRCQIRPSMKRGFYTAGLVFTQYYMYHVQHVCF